VPATNAAPNQDQIVEMSAFEVRTTQGHGYSETNAAAALKTNENIMDIPQSILVVTNDLINDIAAHSTSDTLQFIGVAHTQAYLDFPAVRGGGTGYPYIDDMPDNQSFTDNAFVDTYAVIKGPTEFLYLNAGEGGLILMTTKKPLPYDQLVATARINDWGQYRFLLDATGPVGKVGDAKVGVRVVAWYQSGGFWAQNQVDDRKGIFFAGETDYQCGWTGTIRTSSGRPIPRASSRPKGMFMSRPVAALSARFPTP
jgi:outer membrane receptor protein involved in Fe transport